MNLTKRVKLFKYLVYFYVFVLFIVGTGQVIIGGWLIWDHMGYNLIVSRGHIITPAILVFFSGPLTLFLCWLGCSATYSRKKGFLLFFNVSIVILVSIQVAICAWSLILRDSLPTAAIPMIDESFDNYLLDGTMKYDHIHKWNRLQSELKCCGIHGPTDYMTRGNAAIPWSCCAGSDDPSNSHCNMLHQRGCFYLLSNNARSRLLHSAFAALISGLLQFVGLFCTTQLTQLLKQNRNETDARDAHTDELSSLSFQDKRRVHQELMAKTSRPHRSVDEITATRSKLLKSDTINS